MNIESVIILLIIAVLFIAALRYLHRHGTGSCSGDCAHCSQNCEERGHKK